MTKSRVANAMLLDVPWDGSELASPLTLPGALIAPSYIEHTQIAKPANPPAGKMRLYPKADGKYYTLNSAGIEGELGGAGNVYIHPDPFTIGTLTATNLTATAASIGTLTVSTKATLASPDINGNVRFLTDNTQDLGTLLGGGRPRTLYMGTSIYTPLLQSSADLSINAPSTINIQTGQTTRWVINQSQFRPNLDGAIDIGASANRVRALYLYTFTEQRQQNTPAPPPAGSIRIYPKTNDKLYMLTASNVETEIGTGAAGGGSGSVPDPLILENGLFVNDLVQVENLTFTQPGGRIKGDMSSAPNSTRLMFENSVPNEGSYLGIKPNGTGTLGGLVVYNKDDTANASWGALWSEAEKVVVGSGASGSGVAKPLSIWSDGEKWIVSITGHIFAANDNLYDIGASAAGRPHDLNLGGTATVANVGASGQISAGGNFIVGNSYKWGQTGDAESLYKTSTGQIRLSGASLTVDNSLKMGSYMEQSIIATPATPPTGTMRLYPKIDGKFYGINAAGVEKPLGADDPLTLENGLTVNDLVSLENLTFLGIGRRIKGDFSSATLVDRVAFQTSTANSQTSVGVFPSGTAIGGNYVVWGGLDPANTHYLSMGVDASVVSFTAGRVGTGVYKPLIISQNGLEKMRFSVEGRTSLSGPSDVAITGNAYVNPTGDVWTRYDTVNAIGHLVVGRGNMVFYSAAAGGAPPAFVSRFSVAADGTTTTGYLNAAGHISSNDGANGLLRAGAGDLYLRPVGAGNSVRMDTGAATFITTGRLVVGTYDPAWPANFTGNPITSGRWYQQANGGAYCIDITDCSESVVGSKMVQRAAAGYIYANYVNMTADIQSGAPAYVLGQNGDNFGRWYPKA